MRYKLVLTAGAVLWVAVAGMGLRTLWSYALTPGDEGHPPSQWPAESRLPRVNGLPTLVVVAHPQCPCSRATVAELARLMAHVAGRVTAHVIFLRPPGFDQDWVESDLWRQSKAIPGINVWTDDRGIEAQRFGTATSGHTLLYDATGRLKFSGGITGARGHAGDNDGERAVTALLLHEITRVNSTPVFGCSLVDPASSCTKGGASCPKS